MKRGREIDKWYPFYIDKWLFGSTRHELIIRPGWAERYSEIAPLLPESILKQPFTDLRGIFADLMTISKKDGGFIRANENTPYPVEQLAGMFFVPIEQLRATITICLHKDVRKLTEPSPGIYYIESTEEYGFSDRWKRKVASKLGECSGKMEQGSEKREQGSEKGDPILKDKTKYDSESSREDLSTDVIKVTQKWNQFAEEHGLAKIMEVAKESTREGHLRARMKRKDFDFDALLDAIGKSPFLLGDAGKEPFFATFDWIICPSNYQKIIEGNYFDKRPARHEAGMSIPQTAKEKETYKKLREEYEVAKKRFMQKKGYATEDDIPFNQWETFSDFVARKKREEKKK